MPRLRNVRTGAVVSVSDETAVRLGSGWEPADKPTPRKRARTKKAASSEPTPDSDES